MKVFKKQNNAQEVVLAIAAGSETKESSSFELQVMQGLVPLKILAVNPTKAELEKIDGRVLEKEIEYTTDKDGVKQVRIDFIVESIINEKYKCDKQLRSKVTFFLENKPAYTSDNTKVAVLNAYGQATFIPVEHAKANTLPENMQWYVKKGMRPAMKGEVELVAFLKAFLGIPNLSFKDKIIPNPSDAEIQLEKVSKYFSGDISEIKNAVKTRIATNSVVLCGGARMSENNKIYQAWYLKKPLKPATTDLSFIRKEIATRQSQLNVDFGDANLSFKMYSNNPSAITENNSYAGPGIEEDPFEQSMASGIPANQNQEKEWWA